MLKQLEGVPGVKWKSPTYLVLDLKGMIVERASTSKQYPNQDGYLKSEKVQSSKRRTKLKKPKEKKTTQRVIDSLDEYYQTIRCPIKLVEFMSELSSEDSLPVETCRVILVTPVNLTKENYVEEATSEICLVASSMDYNSEEDLFFPNENEFEQDITSQMGHVRLEGDSELEIESLDAMMADFEEDAPSSEKKQVGRKKAMTTLPKAAIATKERKHVPHLGSDTDEDEVTPTKSWKACQSIAKGKKKAEYSDFDYDYESTHGLKLRNMRLALRALIITILLYVSNSSHIVLTDTFIVLDDRANSLQNPSADIFCACYNSSSWTILDRPRQSYIILDDLIELCCNHDDSPVR
ncbi:hypothetical protein MA16_Dca014495 [Dendrobium catenatum]|uniref:Uncharacterized protein n=1 Tax=Dendrobium catenatum TaxID=906689 RepID=A0A2I0W313_9ASPA|nr:hypothetical protein MA16_Dca014495 [Dendrobium catenatum]